LENLFEYSLAFRGTTPNCTVYNPHKRECACSSTGISWK